MRDQIEEEIKDENKKSDGGSILEDLGEVVLDGVSCIGDGICAVGEGIGSIFGEILS